MSSSTLRSPSILTANGTYFDFFNPEGYEYDIEVIAHSLSHICRFTGHVRGFYSVAQHSVLVSHIVPPPLAYMGIMHDTAEPFLGDVSSPLKSLLSDYREIERRVEAAIGKYFGFPSVMWDEVRKADLIALATEKRDLLPVPTAVQHWQTCETQYEPLAEQILPLGPNAAFHLFMTRYEQVKHLNAKGA